MKDKLKRFIGAILCITLLFNLSCISVDAATVYKSDGVEYEEGYIIVGESHIVLTADAYRSHTDEDNAVIGLEDVYFNMDVDSSIETTEDGTPNTFIMTGNLFFVFQGNRPTDGSTQYSKEYIYSDGEGNCGIAVDKIHEIMEVNTNIEHWNIISFQGAVSALEGETAGVYYADSYDNWINYEFPEAECYFLSHSTMTKYYKKDRAAALAFDEVLKERLGDRYIDCTEFFNSRYPDGMREPDQAVDTIHWNYDTYIDLFNGVIAEIQEKNASADAVDMLGGKLDKWHELSLWMEQRIDIVSNGVKDLCKNILMIE